MTPIILLDLLSPKIFESTWDIFTKARGNLEIAVLIAGHKAGSEIVSCK